VGGGRGGFGVLDDAGAVGETAFDVGRTERFGVFRIRIFFPGQQPPESWFGDFGVLVIWVLVIWVLDVVKVRRFVLGQDLEILAVGLSNSLE
jgi:hypothetical protein